MSSYVVFGAGGQLGTELVKHLESLGAEVHGADREACDVTSYEAVLEFVRDARPDVVFNAAGFTDVDQAESVRQVAMQVNGIGAANVAAATRRARARLVHFSSHYVFGAGHTRPIDEAHEPAPLSNYGKSKLWGEELVRRNCPTSFVVRTSALYSRFGRNVVNQITEVVLKGKESVTAIEDEIMSPTPAVLVARAAVALAETDVFGTYHASTSGECSWFDFVSAFVEKLTLDVDVHSVTQERWGAAARRPRYSALDNLMLRTLGLDDFPDWETGLDHFIAEQGEQLVWEMA